MVRKFLQKELGKKDLDKIVRVWDEFENCKRGSQSPADFLDSFDSCYNAVVQMRLVLTWYMVLKRAGPVNDTQRMLVFSKIDLEDKDDMYENMCQEIKLVLGGVPGGAKQNDKAFYKL